MDTKLGTGSLTVGPIITGLWQMADQERDGKPFDLDAAAEALVAYGRDGFLTFDMADHYGSAEIVAGRAAKLLEQDGPRPTIMTKWCPPPGPMDLDTVRAGVERALDRIGTDRIDLMQFHWWRYESPEYLDAMSGLMQLRSEGLIGEIGVTNFDAPHLRLLAKHGIEVVSNQVSFSLVDRRAAGALSVACDETGARLLAYGTLCGGFLSDRWVGQPEPQDIPDWSRMKYKRFIDTAGGWARFQTLLATLKSVADKHVASVSNVASRWVLDHAAVASVIVGARLGEGEHRADNRRLLSLALDDEDRAAIDAARMDPIPGDCGDEYRRPPFLTASGDLSHHLDALPPVHTVVQTRPGRSRADSGSVWEEICGFSRATRSGNRILVSGTTATDPHGNPVCEGDPEGQAVYILDKIIASVTSLGGTPEDIVRTRIYMVDLTGWEGVSRAHAQILGHVRPANTLIGIGGLIGPYLVEIEAEAELG